MLPERDARDALMSHSQRAYITATLVGEPGRSNDTQSCLVKSCGEIQSTGKKDEANYKASFP
jgi:hypothetical protein